MSLTPSRRGLLQAALLAGSLAPVTACTSSDDGPKRVDPDDALRREAVARERALIARYAGSSSPVLAAIRAEHEQHLAALGAGPDASATPSAPGPAAPSPVAELVRAERAAAAAHADGALRASRALAMVLGSLAASEAAHPVALS